MTKPETREEIRLRRAIAAWQPCLQQVAEGVGVKPAFVRLATVTLEGGAREIQICVAGRGDSDTKHNHKAVARGVKAFASSAGLPAIQVKRHSPSCEHHIGAQPS